MFSILKSKGMSSPRSLSPAITSGMLISTELLNGVITTSPSFEISK
ncbi:MAG: hypothetical protein BWY78_01397 [Alphaproteobacteria bacterium ADurb.Bin438]|nr:MAG: hypothetical protein BWY78_01397 [Alphaproteobacteria bacterium ADurb.Bin438]